MLTWLAIAWSVVRWWQSRDATDPRVAKITLGVAALGLVVVCTVNVVDAARAGNPDPLGSRTVAALTPRVRAALPAGGGVVEIRSGSTPGSVWTGAGIADALERDGIDTVVSKRLGFAYGADRVVEDGEGVRLVVLPAEPDDVKAMRRRDCFEEAGRSGRVTLFLGDPDCLGLNRG
jgi:hypothetical protein